VWLDSTRLCWCVRTAVAAIISKPQSHCSVFVSLTGLDWTRLDSVGVYAPQQDKSCTRTFPNWLLMMHPSERTYVYRLRRYWKQIVISQCIRNAFSNVSVFSECNNSFCISFAPFTLPISESRTLPQLLCVGTKQNILCHHIFVLIDRNCDWWQADRSDCHCFLSVPRVREHDTQIIHPLQWCGRACPLSDLFCYPVTWKVVGAGWDVLTPTWLCLFTSDRSVCLFATELFCCHRTVFLPSKLKRPHMK
jgi:hypothetical protein